MTYGQEYDSLGLNKNQFSIEHSASIGLLLDRNNDTSSGRFTGEIKSGVNYKRIGAALGVGVDNYKYSTALPLFVELHYDLKKGRFIPYYFIRGGYSKVYSTSSEFDRQDVSGGMIMGAGFGVKKKLNNYALSVSVSYQGQKMTTSIDSPYYFGLISPWGGGPNSTTERTMNRVSMKVGIHF